MDPLIDRQTSKKILHHGCALLIAFARTQKAIREIVHSRFGEVERIQNHVNPVPIQRYYFCNVISVKA